MQWPNLRGGDDSPRDVRRDTADVGQTTDSVSRHGQEEAGIAIGFSTPSWRRECCRFPPVGEFCVLLRNDGSWLVVSKHDVI